MKRQIIQIDPDKCNGCGACIPNCPEGAIQLIDGKARLISDLFCDGLGACLGHCPVGAIIITQRSAEPYDEKQVMVNIVSQGTNVIIAHLKHLYSHHECGYMQQAIKFLQEHNIPIPDGPWNAQKEQDHDECDCHDTSDEDNECDCHDTSDEHDECDCHDTSNEHNECDCHTMSHEHSMQEHHGHEYEHYNKPTQQDNKLTQQADPDHNQIEHGHGMQEHHGHEHEHYGKHSQNSAEHHGHFCPSAKPIVFSSLPSNVSAVNTEKIPSQLRQWPVQLHLISPNATYFQNQDLLVTADCVAYALGDFHREYLAGKSLVVACPKLDEGQEEYLEKLVMLMTKVRSITIMIMEVPCCRGLFNLVMVAQEQSGKNIPIRCIVVGLQGNIISDNPITTDSK